MMTSSDADLLFGRTHSRHQRIRIKRKLSFHPWFDLVEESHAINVYEWSCSRGQWQSYATSMVEMVVISQSTTNGDQPEDTATYTTLFMNRNRPPYVRYACPDKSYINRLEMLSTSKYSDARAWPSDDQEAIHLMRSLLTLLSVFYLPRQFALPGNMNFIRTNSQNRSCTLIHPELLPITPHLSNKLRPLALCESII
jgi:hypothetical protein